MNEERREAAREIKREYGETAQNTGKQRGQTAREAEKECGEATQNVGQTAQEQKWRYEDILYLPHPEPVTHPRLPRQDRAAQFAPFAALTGHGEAINETRKQHEQRYTAAP